MYIGAIEPRVVEDVRAVEQANNVADILGSVSLGIVVCSVVHSRKGFSTQSCSARRDSYFSSVCLGTLFSRHIRFLEL